MPTQLKIKSSVVEGKIPDSLAAAELAINLKDQKLFSADSDGNVFEIGAGSATPSPSPPDSPAEGDLWYDTLNSTLNFWDGSQWVALGEAGDSPVKSVNGETGVVVLDAADVGAATEEQGALAETALQPGDNVSDLNNDSGYLTSALQPGDNVSELNNDSGYLTAADLPDDGLWKEDGDSITPKKEDSDLLIQGKGTFASDVCVGDAYTFSSRLEIISALPRIIRERFESALSEWETAAPYEVNDPSSLPADESLKDAIVRVTTAGKINLNADGTADFASTITSPHFDLEALPALP